MENIKLKLLLSLYRLHCSLHGKLRMSYSILVSHGKSREMYNISIVGHTHFAHDSRSIFSQKIISIKMKRFSFRLTFLAISAGKKLRQPTDCVIKTFDRSRFIYCTKSVGMGNISRFPETEKISIKMKRLLQKNNACSCSLVAFGCVLFNVWASLYRYIYFSQLKS